MSNQPPIEVPQGAIRLNTDSQKLEFFAQDRWYEGGGGGGGGKKKKPLAMIHPNS